MVPLLLSRKGTAPNAALASQSELFAARALPDCSSPVVGLFCASGGHRPWPPCYLAFHPKNVGTRWWMFPVRSPKTHTFRRSARRWSTKRHFQHRLVGQDHIPKCCDVQKGDFLSRPGNIRKPPGRSVGPVATGLFLEVKRTTRMGWSNGR